MKNRLPAKDKPYILGASLDPPIYMKVVTTGGDVLMFNFSSVDEMHFVWRYLERWLNRQRWVRLRMPRALKQRKDLKGSTNDRKYD